MICNKQTTKEQVKGEKSSAPIMYNSACVVKAHNIFQQ
jgi:hypothetical protein